MAIRTVLVVVSGVPGDTARLKAGLALAARAQAGVAVLHVKPSPILYAGGGGMEMPVALIEAQVQDIDRRALAIEEEVKALAGKSGAAIDWRCEEGDEITVAGLHARYADLVVASPDVARDLVFDAASPILAFPDEAKADAPRRVLLAWNGSREAARAARDALPLLKAAETVDVIVVDPPAGRPIGVDLGRFLGSHGITVEIRERLSGGADIGALLLEEARTSGAELLVMGAYGHSRLREWVLGGATEEALETQTIPVLLSH